MAESPRRADLRLTIPAKAPFRELAVELADKFAEYAGISPQRAPDLHSAVEAAVAETAADTIDIAMVSQGDQLVLTTGPSNRRTTFPLSD